ncbi:LuxR C-terminal-related transcriptional regulator [Methylobacterium symbioticum]|uniref:Response regulator protein VraR n=1 Tax=Methylobacterium symbioticum TaxID=2584084 RepID=A0A509ED19_9HYPH|nr:response regulator transcription factor [Methylobacterium symbioticum]VUD72111.1 Response regulator protein VraR [Methylobacterium symbioticum]
MSDAVGVLILDEPQELCPTFRATLEHLPALQTVTEADLNAGWAGPAVAVVFLDESRLGDGLARIVALRDRQPELRILAAFQALTSKDLRAVLTAGIDAVMARSAAPREICAAVLALADGAACLVADREEAPESGEALGLTPREAEVLRFLSAGFSNKEVARRLALSVRTVETHRLNLRRKTQTGRLKDLVTLARQLGLAPVVEGERGRNSRH